MTHELLHGDCLEAMAAMDAGSVDAVCCDPPYGLEFMGKEWDKLGDKSHRHASVERSGMGLPRYGTWMKSADPKGQPKILQQREAMQEWHEEWATEALRVLKPSHYLLAFGGTRTWHRLACAIEDAGFEIRDTLMWLYGSGFPKGKSCLKPAWEPIILARKPGPMRELGIDECRIPSGPDHAAKCASVVGLDSNRNGSAYGEWTGKREDSYSPSGRWPANLILECTCDETREGTAKSGTAVRHNSGGKTFGSDSDKPPMDDMSYAPDGKEPVRIHTDPNCPCAMLDAQTGRSVSSGGHTPAKTSDTTYGKWDTGRLGANSGGLGDSGGASRFFLRADYDEGDVPVDTDYHRQINQRSTL